MFRDYLSEDAPNETSTVYHHTILRYNGYLISYGGGSKPYFDEDNKAIFDYGIIPRTDNAHRAEEDSNFIDIGTNKYIHST